MVCDPPRKASPFPRFSESWCDLPRVPPTEMPAVCCNLARIVLMCSCKQPCRLHESNLPSSVLMCLRSRCPLNEVSTALCAGRANVRGINAVAVHCDEGHAAPTPQALSLCWRRCPRCRCGSVCSGLVASQKGLGKRAEAKRPMPSLARFQRSFLRILCAPW